MDLTLKWGVEELLFDLIWEEKDLTEDVTEASALLKPQLTE